jgi:hypothetical protein
MSGSPAASIQAGEKPSAFPRFASISDAGLDRGATVIISTTPMKMQTGPSLFSRCVR